MKAEEAIRALAFLSNPQELTTPPFSSLLKENRDDSFGGSFRGKLTKSLTRLLSEKALDLFSIIDNGNHHHHHNHNNNNNNSNCNNNNSHNPEAGTNSTCTTPEDSDNGYFSSCHCSDNKAGVCFGTVEVRKYPITIGANPSVSRGVPRTIEWDHLEEETECHHINVYERERPNETRKRGEELLLDGVTRAKMLRDLGYTKTQLLEGIRRAKEHKGGNGGNGGSNGNGNGSNGSSGGGGWQRRKHDPVSMRMGSKR